MNALSKQMNKVILASRILKMAFSTLQVSKQQRNHQQTPQLTKTIEWNIEPATMKVHVASNSVDLGAAFVITGFNLHGHVFDENRMNVEF